MAKRKTMKHYPVVRSAPISAGAAANTLVDGAAFLSKLNRRLYRYGRNYSMKVDVRPDYAGTSIEVFALRDDWAVQKAFQMAYQVYLDNTIDEREKLASGQVARWEDFRIRDGVTLPINQADPVLHAPAGTASLLTAGEFEFSTVEDGAGVARTFTWGAASASRYSILEEYDRAGNAQKNPEGDTNTGPYGNIDTNVDAAIMQDLQEHGAEPPYNADGVNALTPWVRIAVLGSGAAGQQKLSSGFFTAPCGLILLKGFTETSEAYSVEIEAKSGDYKGVHAPSMLEIATVNRKRKVVK